ncbi:MAG: NAD(P)/FAD-dependent oxidoreductase [Lachnospiraceae bacterium]|nr:NAD(P)/FAD-dependent oxidoreductase [Lachnospiraceae bacterium]
MSTVAVIGGGASGMMAAYAAGAAGHQVTLFEHGDKLGKKLYITGKGRCNLTNSCQTEELFLHFSHNSKFLYSAIHRFDNQAVMDFFEDQGLFMKVEHGGCVFPWTDHAADVVEALKRALQSVNVHVCLNTQASDLALRDSQVIGVVCSPVGSPEDREVFSCDAVIFATGGRSYPQTGSDGSGWEILTAHGHTLTEIRPALVGMRTGESYITAMQGLSLQNVSLCLRDKRKTQFEDVGELLFTHQGISGPLVLKASSLIPDACYGAPLSFEIDVKPSLDEEELDRLILKHFEENANRQLKNSLAHLLPAKMIPVVISLSGTGPDRKVNGITRQERSCLRAAIKHFPGTITGLCGWEDAMVTRGGVPVSEVNPRTMESRLIKGLYLCGEMIDVDALTGGFNLQIAWSTGHLAGSSVL